MVFGVAHPYLFYPVKRVDIKGKETLTIGGKHYIILSGIRNYPRGYCDSDQACVFESMVYQQLVYEAMTSQ